MPKSKGPKTEAMVELQEKLRKMTKIIDNLQRKPKKTDQDNARLQSLLEQRARIWEASSNLLKSPFFSLNLLILKSPKISFNFLFFLKSP